MPAHEADTPPPNPSVRRLSLTLKVRKLLHLLLTIVVTLVVITVSEGRVLLPAPRKPVSLGNQHSEGRAIKPAPQRQAGVIARPFWRGVGVGVRGGGRSAIIIAQEAVAKAQLWIQCWSSLFFIAIEQFLEATESNGLLW
ncbi:hypothetical protein PGT21_028468 [Puccinia graminis f. sp. tritici]|uniref:Uncharacterized protein n=1 Tax=Puccinia graminis f. sp. tritici TaxID=56615 RepID=A0A5B0RS06_PUCGR|nr:hypothetical protein PGT21_028468 [Puccinia graminis f. sp. tritici]KAA1128129.1 hypothetical protein PGTUg99_013884 [Puccinia graminis f. sp. tritici]